MSRKPPITSAELKAKLVADPEFVARQKRRDQELTEREARFRTEEEPILADLRRVGIAAESAWDLVNTSTPYPEALPILLEHLQRPYSDVVRGGIARSLAVYDARPFWPVLVREFRKVPPAGEGQGLGAKDGLAVALSVIATEAVMDELIALAKDRSQGSSRIFFVKPLMRSKSEAAKRAIEELSSDPQLEKEIAIRLKNRARRSKRKAPPSG